MPSPRSPALRAATIWTRPLRPRWAYCSARPAISASSVASVCRSTKSTVVEQAEAVRHQPLLRRAQAVAGAAHGLQQLALEIAVDLLPEPAHMHVDHIGLRIEMVIPDILQQHRPGYHMAGVAHHVFEQL